VGHLLTIAASIEASHEKMNANKKDSYNEEMKAMMDANQKNIIRLKKI
jgi:hypothetical protein